MAQPTTVDDKRNAKALHLAVRPVLKEPAGEFLILDVIPRLPPGPDKQLEGAGIWSAVRTRKDIDAVSSALSANLGLHWLKWRKAGLNLPLSIPVSVIALEHAQIQRCLFESLHDQGIPPEMLQFRISESELVDNVHAGFRLAQQVRQQGAGVAVGVFGATYARYSEMAELPFDALWISPNFVKRIQDPGVTRDTVLDAIAFGQDRQIPVIAQGIDSEADWNRLQDSPCNAAQGDWIAPELAPKDLSGWLDGPESARAPAPKAAGEAQPTKPPPSRSALIVDDDPLIQNLLQHQLETLGFQECAVAGDGRQAQDILEHHSRFSVIFCDLQMPGMDGIEFLRYAAQRMPLVNVVLVSGVDHKIMRSAASLAEAHHLRLLGTLSKPVRLQTLRALVQRLDQQQEAQAAVTREDITIPELKAALRSGALKAYFQPQVAVADGQLLGAEALVRWEHEQGVLAPAQFLPQATRAGLIPAITELMLRDAVRAQAEWQRHDLRLAVSVNLTMETLCQLDFPDRLVELCREHDVAPEQIKLEITESSAMRDPVTTLDVATRLRMRGFVLAIDDFGTGFSNLSQLREIPFNQLKIDQSFVSISHLDEEAREIVANNIQLARGLDMQSVAEGVETAEDWRLLRQLGCDALQGYFLSRALPAGEFLRWAREDYAPRLQAGELPPS